MTLFLLLAAVVTAQTPAAIFAADCRDGKFMGAVSIQLRGKTVFESACGFANVEWQIRNTVETRFRPASISKQFTAAAVLLLRDEGKLKLQQSIGEFVDDLPAAWRSATIHQLLTHTSGIPLFTAAPNRQLDRLGATPRQLLDLVRDKPLQFPHGQKMAYNNTGYILLGMLIEKVSGASYAEFIARRLFAPAQMNDSGFDIASRILPRRAAPYTVKQGKLENAEQVDASVAWSAGGFYTTVRDLVKWAGVKQPREMYQIYPETAQQGMHYGYGIVIAERNGRRLFYHGGGISGFSSVLQIYPDDGLVIAVLSNIDSDATPTPSWTVADHLAEALLKP